MKRILLCAAMLCTLNSVFADKVTTTMTLWGSKSVNNPNNPCKGSATSVCGKIIITVDSISENVTSVKKVTYNAESQPIYSVSNTTEKPIKEVLEELEIEMPEAKLNKHLKREKTMKIKHIKQ